MQTLWESTDESSYIEGNQASVEIQMLIIMSIFHNLLDIGGNHMILKEIKLMILPITDKPLGIKKILWLLKWKG